MASERTLAGRWNQSGDHSECTFPVPDVDTVLIGLSGCGSHRWAWGSLEVAKAGKLEVGSDDRLGVVDRCTWQCRSRHRLGGRCCHEHSRSHRWVGH